MMNQSADILQRIQRALPSVDSAVLHEPDLGPRERELVADCVDSGWVSSVGKYVDRFEQMLVEYTGARHAVVVVNGTAALHVSLILAGVQPDDEVLCPALSFIATANAVAYCRAVPHFVDTERRTLGMDPCKLGDHLREIAEHGQGQLRNRLTGRRIAAVVPMHTFGHPVDLQGVQEVCDRYGLPMIEDAAESLGSYYKGQHTGTFGAVSAVSFNGNKIITTGGGGAILTNDPALAARAKHLTTTAKRPHRWQYVHDEVGFNYRLPNLNAALGCAQLERLEALRSSKRELAERYRRAFADCPHAQFFVEPEDCSSNYWLNAILVRGGQAARDALLEATGDLGFMTRPVWDLLCDLPMYRDCPRMDLSESRRLARQVVCLPSSACLAAAAAHRKAA